LSIFSSLPLAPAHQSLHVSLSPFTFHSSGRFYGAGFFGPNGFGAGVFFFFLLPYPFSVLNPPHVNLALLSIFSFSDVNLQPREFLCYSPRGAPRNGAGFSKYFSPDFSPRRGSYCISNCFFCGFFGCAPLSPESSLDRPVSAFIFLVSLCEGHPRLRVSAHSPFESESFFFYVNIYVPPVPRRRLTSSAPPYLFKSDFLFPLASLLLSPEPLRPTWMSFRFGLHAPFLLDDLIPPSRIVIQVSCTSFPLSFIGERMLISSHFSVSFLMLRGAGSSRWSASTVFLFSLASIACTFSRGYKSRGGDGPVFPPLV